ncbi:hypothetical protein ACHAQA_001613 [Verticillium albo-atrum]
MDPLSVVASTIGVLQSVPFTYQSIAKINDRPKAFDQVVKHPPLVQRILRNARNRLEEVPAPLDQEEHAAILDILKACDDKAKELDRIFKAIDSKCKQDQEITTWLRARPWYRNAVRGIKANRVEALMNAILEHVERLALQEIFRLATQDDVQAIKKAIEDLAAVEPSLDDSEFDSKRTIHATQSVAAGAYGQQNSPGGGVNTFVSGKYNITGSNATVNFGKEAP